MRAIVLMTLVVLCATSAMGASFQNGSFETPERLVSGGANGGNGRTDYVIQTGWSTYTGGTLNPQVCRYLNDPAVFVPDGRQYVQANIITTANKYAGFRQTFDVLPGWTYTIKGWYRPLSGSVTSSVGVDLTGGTTRPTVWGAQTMGNNPVTGTTWQQFQFQVTATGSSMTLFLDNYTTSAGKATAFDAIVIPEPGTVVALISGMVGLVAIGMRRRR